MAEIIHAINELFKTIFQSFRSSPIISILVFITFIIAYISIANNEILVNSTPTTEVEQERFKNVVNSNDNITNIMEEKRAKLDADRILIRQFHNGKYGISGIPFTFVQTTHVASSPGRGLDDREAWISYPISTMSKTLSKMFYSNDVTRPHCIIVDTQTVEDDFYKAYLKRYEVDTSVKCPLLNAKGDVVGLIGASFSKDQFTQEEYNNKVIPIIEALSYIIVAELSSVNKSPSRWYEFWK